MDIQEHTKPHNLEKYSFLWSEARLIIAAAALFIGGTPVLYAINPFYGLMGLVNTILTITWILSGLASIYLLYRWNAENKMIFGGKDNLDMAAFFISIISGIHLGIAGLFGTNIGMMISSSYILFVIVAVLYLASAWRLYSRWSEKGKKLF